MIHDYNYAQVLTLDLAAKGYAYAEVPISYEYRSGGRSFVRLVPYLRHVIPAVHREDPRSILDDVIVERATNREPPLAVQASFRVE